MPTSRLTSSMAVMRTSWNSSMKVTQQKNIQRNIQDCHGQSCHGLHYVFVGFFFLQNFVFFFCDLIRDLLWNLIHDPIWSDLVRSWFCRCRTNNSQWHPGNYKKMQNEQNSLMQMNIWKIIYLNCGERYEFMIDHGSYTHNLNSCEIKAWKKFRPQQDSNPCPH